MCLLFLLVFNIEKHIFKLKMPANASVTQAAHRNTSLWNSNQHAKVSFKKMHLKMPGKVSIWLRSLCVNLIYPDMFCDIDWIWFFNVLTYFSKGESEFWDLVKIAAAGKVRKSPQSCDIYYFRMLIVRISVIDLKYTIYDKHASDDVKRYMSSLSASRSLCTRNPTVTREFSSKRNSEVELWQFVVTLNKLLQNWFIDWWFETICSSRDVTMIIYT